MQSAHGRIELQKNVQLKAGAENLTLMLKSQEFKEKEKKDRSGAERRLFTRSRLHCFPRSLVKKEQELKQLAEITRRWSEFPLLLLPF